MEASRPKPQTLAAIDGRVMEGHKKGLEDVVISGSVTGGHRLTDAKGTAINMRAVKEPRPADVNRARGFVSFVFFVGTHTRCYSD